MTVARLPREGGGLIRQRATRDSRQALRERAAGGRGVRALIIAAAVPSRLTTIVTGGRVTRRRGLRQLRCGRLRRAGRAGEDHHLAAGQTPDAREPERERTGDEATNCVALS